MRVRPTPDTPFFDFVSVDATDVARHPDALERMLDKRLDGMIVRGVFTRETVDQVVERLESPSVPRTVFPAFAGTPNAPYTVGQAIVSADPSLTAYFEDAGKQRERIRALFDGLADFEGTLRQIFGALAAGRPIAVPAGPGGATSPFATLRVLPEGHEIGVHVGNDFIRLPQARYLAEQVDMTDQISYFVTLAAPQGGGELVVYPVEWADVRALVPAPDGTSAGIWNEGTEVFATLEGFGSTAFRPEPGDLLIFDGGRYFHRVSKTVGERPRRTIGGFLGFSIDRERVFVWS